MAKKLRRWRYLDEHGDWIALVNLKASSEEWTSIKVILAAAKAGQTNGRFFSVAWNGERFAETNDLVRFQQRHPDIFAWVHRLCAGPTRLRAV